MNRTCQTWSSQESACSCEPHFIKKIYKMGRTTFSLLIHDWRSPWICTTFLSFMKWVGKWPFCRGKASPFHRGTIKGDVSTSILGTWNVWWKNSWPSLGTFRSLFKRSLGLGLWLLQVRFKEPLFVGWPCTHVSKKSSREANVTQR